VVVVAGMVVVVGARLDVVVIWGALLVVVRMSVVKVVGAADVVVRMVWKYKLENCLYFSHAHAD